MPTIGRWTPERVGCYVSDTRGRYAIPFMIREVAIPSGFPITEDDAAIVARAWTGDDADDPNGFIGETTNEIADEAEAWLNEHIAPEDHAFGWHEGDFILASLATWEVIA